MKDEELVEILLRDHLLAAAALTALQLRQLPPDAQAHLNEAILAGTGHVELRTRIDCGQVTRMAQRVNVSPPSAPRGNSECCS